MTNGRYQFPFLGIQLLFTQWYGQMVTECRFAIKECRRNRHEILNRSIAIANDLANKNDSLKMLFLRDFLHDLSLKLT